MEGFAKANPHTVSRIALSQAPAPGLPGGLKAQQAAGWLSILCGPERMRCPRGSIRICGFHRITDYGACSAVAAGIYFPGVWKMQGLAQNQAVCVVYCPAGPIIELMTDAMKVPSIRG